MTDTPAADAPDRDAPATDAADGQAPAAVGAGGAAATGAGGDARAAAGAGGDGVAAPGAGRVSSSASGVEGTAAATDGDAPATDAAAGEMPAAGRLPEGEVTLQTLAMPVDTNANGDIFGGWLMGQMDLGASVLARRRSRGRVATVQVDAMTFHHPVRVGDVVSIHALMLREGRSSMRIGVEAWIERQPQGLRLKVTEATFTFVAIGEDGRSRPLP